VTEVANVKGTSVVINMGKEHSNVTMNELVQAVKATGSIGVVGVFVPKDPKSKRN
jgi:threonine dehydrogenase-like Zn-dependent dehydrogenase